MRHIRRISYVPSERAVRVVWYVAALLLVGLVLWLAWMVAHTNDRLADAETKRVSLEEAATRNAAAVSTLSAQVEALGGKPVVDVDDLPVGPQGETGEQGERGETGEPGPPPSAAQIDAALARYCAQGRCDGDAPTASQVSAAVTTYCDARGECRGEAGRAGANGRPGANGRNGSDGKDAPPPTREQIAAAVSAYCAARGECRGPAGTDGAPGADGSDGRGIASVVCEGAPITRFTFTYSDGTTETVTCAPAL